MGRWRTCCCWWASDRWVGSNIVAGLVEDLSVGWWLVVVGPWPVGEWWFCNKPN